MNYTSKKIIFFCSALVFFNANITFGVKEKAKVPTANSMSCRVSIDPGTDVDNIRLTEKTSTDFLVSCLLGGYKSIGTIDIGIGMRALKPAQEKQLIEKGFKITTLANGDIGIASSQQALDNLVQAYNLPEGPRRDEAIGRALAFTIITEEEKFKKDVLLKKFCHEFCDCCKK